MIFATLLTKANCAPENSLFCKWFLQNELLKIGDEFSFSFAAVYAVIILTSKYMQHNFLIIFALLLSHTVLPLFLQLTVIWHKETHVLLGLQ